MGVLKAHFNDKRKINKKKSTKLKIIIKKWTKKNSFLKSISDLNYPVCEWEHTVLIFIIIKLNFKLNVQI